MTQSRTQSTVTDLWGWETFFAAELGHFLGSSGRNFATTSEPYANFVLEMCIISLNAIKVNLEGALTTTNDANHEMFCTYCGQVEEILCICRSLIRRWEQKIEDINSSTSNSLQPALIRSTRGCPCFDIS